MEGGDSYVHTCSCGKSFNQSCGAMREYNGNNSYTLEELRDELIITQEDVDALKDINTAKDVIIGIFKKIGTSQKVMQDKQNYADKQHYAFKNPPIYTPPKVEDYDRMIADKQQELEQLQTQKAEITLKTVKEVIK